MSSSQNQRLLRPNGTQPQMMGYGQNMVMLPSNQMPSQIYPNTGYPHTFQPTMAPQNMASHHPHPHYQQGGNVNHFQGQQQNVAPVSRPVHSHSVPIAQNGQVNQPLMYGYQTSGVTPNMVQRDVDMQQHQPLGAPMQQYMQNPAYRAQMHAPYQATNMYHPQVQDARSQAPQGSLQPNIAASPLPNASYAPGLQLNMGTPQAVHAQQPQARDSRSHATQGSPMPIMAGPSGPNASYASTPQANRASPHAYYAQGMPQQSMAHPSQPYQPLQMIPHPVEVTKAQPAATKPKAPRMNPGPTAAQKRELAAKRKLEDERLQEVELEKQRVAAQQEAEKEKERLRMEEAEQRFLEGQEAEKNRKRQRVEEAEKKNFELGEAQRDEVERQQATKAQQMDREPSMSGSGSIPPTCEMQKGWSTESCPTMKAKTGESSANPAMVHNSKKRKEMHSDRLVLPPMGLDANQQKLWSDSIPRLPALVFDPANISQYFGQRPTVDPPASPSPEPEDSRELAELVENSEPIFEGDVIGEVEAANFLEAYLGSHCYLPKKDYEQVIKLEPLED